MDLFVTRGDYRSENPFSSNLLYHNEGNGNFTKVISGDIVNDLAHFTASNWADFNNDGNIDLFVTSKSQPHSNKVYSYLYFNNGDGSFRKILTGDIVTSRNDAWGNSWTDYNNDGFLDLYSLNWSLPGPPNSLYLNSMEGLFEKQEEGLIVNRSDLARCSNWIDYDNDGDFDLFTANAFMLNSLYINMGNNEFNIDSTFDFNGASSSWGDFNNDGYLDLFLTKFFNGSLTANLYKNNQNGSFENIITNVSQFSGPYCSNWGDYDNDGDLDLFITMGPEEILTNKLFLNDGLGNFTEVTTGDIVKDYGHTCSTCDCDNDGDLDIFTTRFKFDTDLPNALYLNNGNDNNWIIFKCIGTNSNRDGLGTRIKIKAYISGNPTWQFREITQQSGFMVQSDQRAHFGLGDANVIDSVYIEWPSGVHQVLTNISPNQIKSIQEPFQFTHDLTISSSELNYAAVANYSQFRPVLYIRNNGESAEHNFTVSCIIDSAGTELYFAEDTIDALPSLETTVITFSNWFAKNIGSYEIKFEVNLLNDENTVNNIVSNALFVSNLIDDFESGVSKWEINGNWGLSGTYANSGQKSLSTDPKGSYENNSDSWVIFKDFFDLSGLENAHISFYTKYMLELNSDFGYIEVSRDSGQTWNQVDEAITGFQTSWIEKKLSLEEYTGEGCENILIRFRFVSDSSQVAPFIGWYIDDIQLFPVSSTSVKNNPRTKLLSKYELSNNYPNPFNPKTHIKFYLPKSVYAEINIYDVTGRLLKTIVKEKMEAGRHNVIFDGENYASGVYFYQLKTNDFTDVKKMLLIK